MEQNNFIRYAHLPVQQVLALLNTNVQSGLDTQEISKRQAQYGANQVNDKSLSWLQIGLQQIRSPFVYTFIAIALLSLIFKEMGNSIVIMLCVSLNLIVGFYQEYRAERSIALIKKHLINKIRVRRDGHDIFILSDKLVPGDIIILYPGDVIPADCRFVYTENLTLDESMLTGESAIVVKTSEPTPEDIDLFNATNIGFAGTTISSGKALGVIIATGIDTVLGSVAYVSSRTIRTSNLMQGTKVLGAFVLKLILITLTGAFLLNLFVKGGQHINATDLFLFLMALAVSAIPEALPIVVTFCLSQGAAKLAEEKVLVKRLSAIEDLGNIDLLCTDKTGTLTENILQVAHVFSSSPRDTLFYAACSAEHLPNEKTEISNKGFDTTLWHSLTFQEQEKALAGEKLKEIPFTPDKRRNIVLIKQDNTYIVIMRGSADEILYHCANIATPKMNEIRTWILEEEKKGNRILATATKRVIIQDEEAYNLDEHEMQMEFLGLISFADPLKATSVSAIKKAQHLGIAIKILSGDSKEVCGSVATQVGLIPTPDQVLTGAEFAAADDEEKRNLVKKYHIFARVTPAQKYTIIELLQMNHTVAYLGDGVNDAPALKLANVSLAVDDAVNVARETADILLLKKSLLVIVNGIEEGRKIFINTMKYIVITMVGNFGNFYALAIATLMIDHLPMLPIHLLLMNLMTDFPLIAISTDTVASKDIKKIQSYNVKDIIVISTVLGSVCTFFNLVIFSLFYRESPATLQTCWFVGSILNDMFLIFSLRTKFFFLSAHRPSTPLLLLTLLVIVITLILPFTSFGQDTLQLTALDMATMMHLLIVVACYAIVTESVKLFYYRQQRSALFRS